MYVAEGGGSGQIVVVWTGVADSGGYVCGEGVWRGGYGWGYTIRYSH